MLFLINELSVNSKSHHSHFFAISIISASASEQPSFQSWSESLSYSLKSTLSKLSSEFCYAIVFLEDFLAFACSACWILFVKLAMAFVWETPFTDARLLTLLKESVTSPFNRPYVSLTCYSTDNLDGLFASSSISYPAFPSCVFNF